LPITGSIEVIATSSDNRASNQRTCAHPPASRNDQIQSRLLILAAIFLLLFPWSELRRQAGRTLDVELHWQHWLGYFIWLVATLLPIASLSETTRPHLPFFPWWRDEAGLLTIWRLFPAFAAPEPVACSGLALARAPSLQPGFCSATSTWLSTAC
jgi:hypothetical protein